MSLKSEVVAHWKRMREDAPGVFEKTKEQPGENDCAFCAKSKIDRKIKEECQGCPIMIATGVATCRSGPYLEAQDAWVIYKNSNWDESQREWWELKADTMITFLEVLPDDA